MLLKVKVFKGKSARTISLTTRVMEAAPSEKAPHFCLMSSGHMSRMALGSCHCDGRTKWHVDVLGGMD